MDVINSLSIHDFACGFLFDGWCCFHAAESAKHKLKVILSGEPLVLHNLDPVTVRIEQKRNVLHLAVGESLLPATVEFLEPLARRIDVVDRDAWPHSSE